MFFLSLYHKQEENIALITSTIVETTQKLCPLFIDEAEKIRGSYSTLLSLYGKCHRGFNSSAFVTEADILEIGEPVTFTLFILTLS